MVWRFAGCCLWLTIVSMSAATVFAQSRPLGPGVLTVIPPDAEYQETYSGPMPLVEIVQGMPELEWTPKLASKSETVFAQAQHVIFRRLIWNLEFAFKPVRLIQVDVPQPSGKMQRKLIWYMVYRIRYLGNDLKPDATTDNWGHPFYQTDQVSHQTRFFFPRFELASHDQGKAYQDRIIPAAVQQITKRESRGEKLLNSVEISQEPIPLSTEESPHEVWGVATWEDIDPNIDFFSIYVQGLTNAFQPVDPPGAFQPGNTPGTGRELLAKTLRLNFWRPGDAVLEHEGEIQYGVPFDQDSQRQSEILKAFGLKKRLDHSWDYR
jgi:hypothetical protein